MNCVNSPEIDTLLPIQKKGDLKSPATIVGQPPLSPMQAYQGLLNSQYAANLPSLELNNGEKEKKIWASQIWWKIEVFSAREISYKILLKYIATFSNKHLFN